MELAITILMVVLLTIIVLKETKDKQARRQICSLESQLRAERQRLNDFIRENVRLTDLILDKMNLKPVVTLTPAKEKFELQKKKKGDKTNAEIRNQGLSGAQVSTTTGRGVLNFSIGFGRPNNS